MVDKRGLILEGLNNMKKANLLFGDNDDELCSIIGEDVEFSNLNGFEMEEIDEAKSITFNKQTFPKEGWAVVMAGGPGSGKGYAIEHKILLSGKVLDVDELKKFYSKISAQGGNTKIAKSTGGRKFDFKNPEDVVDLHNEISAKGLDDAAKSSFFNAAIQTGKLPNVIFDITGSKWTKLLNVGSMCKKLGYKTSFVFVITNREVAMIRNLMRARVVKQEIFHDIHNAVQDTVLHFLQSQDAKYYDEAWLLFSGTENFEEITPEQQKALEDNSVFKLTKSGDKFDIPKDLEEKVYSFLGDKENKPENPEKYKTFDDVKKEIEPYKVPDIKEIKNKSGEVVGTKKGTKLEGYKKLTFKK